MKQGRGQLTQQVQAIARHTLGKEISLTELRLIPYVQNVMLNEQKLDPRKVNLEERRIMAEWRNKGWLSGGRDTIPLSVSKEFWNAMNEILWAAYVDLK